MDKKSKAIIIGGDMNSIIIRPKSGEKIELGELLVFESPDEKIIMNITEIKYSSQISEKNMELISGLNLEEGEETVFYDENLRNYKIAYAKPNIKISKKETNKAEHSKTLPEFFGKLREIKETDMDFMATPEKPLFLGNLRSGSKKLDFEINIDGEKAITHHILVAATTGRGKSNLVKTILWKSMDYDYSGILILDPHNEYFLDEKNEGLKNHPKSGENLEYYTPNAKEHGENSLIIDIRQIKPRHFQGIIELSDPQEQMISLYSKNFGGEWIEKIMLDEKISGSSFSEGTEAVVKRQLSRLLNIKTIEKEGIKEIFFRGIFQKNKGETVVAGICDALENGKKVIINTSSMEDTTELLTGSIITEKIFDRYKKYKEDKTITQKPAVSIILEEAPRMIGKNAINRGGNIFSTIAKEGRKFKTGLLAITQIPSEIPRDILANMNTKIIMGNEMRPERQILIESAAQDLSDYDREIASLSAGEAIITSTFTKMALPVMFPLFSELMKKEAGKKEKNKYPQKFVGME